MSSFDQSALWNIGSEIIGVVGQPNAKQWKSYCEFQPFRARDFTTRFNLLKGFIKRNEPWILKKYSWLPNKRTVWNNSTGQEILQKIINAHEEIIAQGKKNIQKVHERTGWNNRILMNNFSQNIENLACFENIVGWQVFSRIIEKKLET